MYIDPNLQSYFDLKAPLFPQLMALRGQCFRVQPGRATHRIFIGENSYFIKLHFGVGWKEIFKNLIQLRLPILGAKNEWLAIQKLAKLNVGVPTIVGYGQEGFNPATLKSFLLTKELKNIVSLEELCASWPANPPSFSFKLKLIQEVARIARTMHQQGINHRDFYLCHFLLNKASGEIYLIDLHRAQIRMQVPLRWLVKDLAGLDFSARDIGLTKRDKLRFMRLYSQKNLHEIFATDLDFWQQVEARANKLYSKHQA